MKDKIDIADAMGKNETFNWYVNVASPILKEQALREGKSDVEQFQPDNFNEFPICCMLRNIGLRFDIINELDKDKFTIDVFHAAL